MKNTTNIQKFETIISLFEQTNYYISNTTINELQILAKEGQNEQEYLTNILIQRLIIEKKDITLLDGIIFNCLKNTTIKSIKSKLINFFPNGIFIFKSSEKINYQHLQKLLLNEDFKSADRMTQKYLCELIQLKEKTSRNWLYFTDIQLLPEDDLLTIDLLWRIYSNNKFGFSIQRKIWSNNNYNWDQLWTKIGWLENGVMKRYPEGFNWTTDAPKGHLPLFNQLRGNKALFYLFEHAVWRKIQH